MNSQLNREVAEYERSVTQGTHRLDSSEMHQPLASSELEAEARTYVLGGSGGKVNGAEVSNESLEERRRKILEATVNRLKKGEEEIEHGCGTGKTMST